MKNRYQDPVARAERELAELEAKQKAEFGEGAEAGTTNGDQDDKGTTTETGQDGASDDKGDDQGQGTGRQDDGNTDTWKQRYNTLQGMFRAEIDRKVRDATTTLEAKVRDLERELAAAKTGTAATTDTGAGSDDGAVSADYMSPHVTDQMRKSAAYRTMVADYGRRYAEVQFEASVMAAGEQVRPLAQRGEKADYHQRIGELAPGWEQENTNPAFVAWTQVPVPHTGKTRQALLVEAYQAGDYVRVAQFFLDFREEATEKSANPQPKPKQQGAEVHIAPPKRGSSSSSSIDANKGRVYTRSEWEAGWKKLELGTLTAAAAAQLERELTEAGNENRVVG